MSTASSAARAHMAAYFKQEAKEKAEEIEQRTEAEFQAIFAEKIKQASRAVQTEMELRRKDKVVIKKIERSRVQSTQRVAKMQAQNEIMNRVKEECLSSLAAVSQNTRYPELCKFLLAQGLMTITENRVIVRCRNEDLTMIQTQVPGAVHLYQEFIFRSVGIRPSCVVSVDQTEFLPSGPVTGEMRLSCCGGVMLLAREGKIVCRNTLDSRLDLCFEALKPQIRGLLFGVRAPKPSVPSEIDAAAVHIKARIQKQHAEVAAAAAKASKDMDHKVDSNAKK